MFQVIKSRHCTRANKIDKKKHKKKHEQYGLQHSVTRTIQSAQG